jgi:hypothetical protein
MSGRPVQSGSDGRADPVVLTDEVSAPLETLRSAVNDARSMPMSSSVVVNKAELLDLVDRLEAAYLASVGDAQHLVGRRDEVVAAGHEEAQEMLREAKLERDRLVSDTEVFRVATRVAAETVSAAEEEAAALLAETDSYVAERLAAFEGTLDTTLEAVRRGREKLEKKPQQPRRPRQQAAPGGSESPFAALANDSDVDDINLPEHLDP